MVDVKFTPKGEEMLDDLQHDIRDRVLEKLDSVKDWPSHYLDPLSGYPYYKLRIGDYRAIIHWDEDDDTLWVEAVGHRDNFYQDNLPP